MFPYAVGLTCCSSSAFQLAGSRVDLSLSHDTA
jgi:hypothetical protein